LSRTPRSARATATGAYRGVLADPGKGIGRYLVHSTLMHAALVVGSLFAWAQSAAPPPLAPDAFFVSAVVLPKADDLPDRPTRAPKPAPGESGTKQAPPPKPNEMVLPEKEAPKEKGKEPKKEEPPEKEEPTPKAKSRAELLATVGDVSDQDRFATDVDGDADAKPSALDSRFGKRMSKYDRTVHDRVKGKWQPGLALANQVAEGVNTVVSFTINENGSISDIALAEGSGNYAFDMSCAVAVQKVGTLPAPPRAPWPVSILFRPEEKK